MTEPMTHPKTHQMTPAPNPSRPVPPIPLHDAGRTPEERLVSPTVTIDGAVRDELAAACPISDAVTGPDGRAEASRDWWPLALHWALAGAVPRLAGVVARPRSTDEVAALLDDVFAWLRAEGDRLRPVLG